MNPWGFVYAPILWLLAALLLVQFEVNVQVLRPWMRRAYGIAAFFAGIALAILATRGAR